MRIAVIGFTAALAVACSSGHAATTSPSPDPAANAEACRAYDGALNGLFYVGIKDPPAPFAILTLAPPAVPKIRTAAQLADGPTRAAMEKTATRIQVLVDKEAGWQRPGFNNAPEFSAVEASVAEVAGICQKAGITLKGATP